MILKILPALLGLKAAGGLPLLAGGFVRDRFLGIDSDDEDGAVAWAKEAVDFKLEES